MRAYSENEEEGEQKKLNHLRPILMNDFACKNGM